MDRRIATPSGKSEEAKDIVALIERLTASQDSGEPGVFESKQKLLMFAAALGANMGTSVELEQRETSSAIRFEIFENNADDAFVSAVAVAATDSLAVLRPDDDNETRLVTIFEERAYAGLLELRRRIKGNDPLQVLVDIVLSAEFENDATGIADFPDDILRDMLGD
jgi:dnd system-associated protein 4